MNLHKLITAIDLAAHPLSLCEVASDEDCRCFLGEVREIQRYDLERALQESNREFGLRFLLAVVYVARREASEGQIWPAVREGLQLPSSIADLMFLGDGHPHLELKTLLEKCCGHYRLRHIFR